MKKILFTDLFDTLINENQISSREYYNSVEKRKRDYISSYK